MEIGVYHPYNLAFFELWSLHISLIHSPFPIVSFCSRFLDMVTQHFGSVAASTVRGFVAEQFPLLIVGMRNRSAMEICSVLQGKKCLHLSTVFFNYRRVSLTGRVSVLWHGVQGFDPRLYQSSLRVYIRALWDDRESKAIVYYFSPETLVRLFLSRSQNDKTLNIW